MAIVRNIGNVFTPIDPHYASDSSSEFVTAEGGTESRPLSEWFAGLGKDEEIPPIVAMWSDQTLGGVGDPNIWRFRDRVFIGNGAEMHDRRGGAGVGNTGTIFSDDGATPGANWAPRDTTLLAISEVGAMAITGASRSSDGDGATTTPIGVSAFVIADVASRPAWAFYADIQQENVANAHTSGLEIAAKNKGPDYTSTAYVRTNGIHGIYLAGGGDNLYGGAAANPCNTSIYVLKNDDYGWNKGIIFGSDGLTGTDGTDGTSGFGVAIEMARTHRIQWLTPNGTVGALIRSTVQNGSLNHIMSFNNSELLFAQSSGKVAFRVTHVSSAVNGISVTANVAGAAPQLRFSGDDTNGDVALVGKGTGAAYIMDGASVIKFRVNTTGIGFFAATPIAKPSVSGSRGGNAALASLLTHLASYGLITDGSSA